MAAGSIKNNIILKKVLIVGSSKLPIPAVKGGAVPNLIEEIILANEKEKKIDLTCISCYDCDAKLESKKYKNTKFLWADTPNFIKRLDNYIYKFAKNILHLSRLLSLSYFFEIISFTLFVSKCLKKGDYDFVIFENSLPVLHSLRLYGNKRKYKDKYFLHIHTVPRHYYCTKRILKSCKNIISISKYVKNQMIKSTSIKEEKFKILYNSINTEIFKPLNINDVLQIKKKYNIPLDKKIILFVGRLCKDKGIDQLIKAQRMLEKDYFLLIVGSNFYKTNIVSDFEKELINQTEDIKDNIIFTGYIDYKDIANIYNCADVIVLPSMWDEPAGMTIIEGMACKKPVITTISGGIPEYTGNGNCILLKRNADISENIAKSIKKINLNENYSKELSLNAYNRSQKFNLDYYYDSFLEILGVEK